LAICLLSTVAGAANAVDTAKPVKVFILAGQSNMQGHGRLSLGKDGDLDYAAKQEQFAYLKAGGQWAERDDVWYYHKPGKGDVVTSNLKPGLGANATSVEFRGRHTQFRLASCLALGFGPGLRGRSVLPSNASSFCTNSGIGVRPLLRPCRATGGLIRPCGSAGKRGCVPAAPPAAEALGLAAARARANSP